MFGPPTSPLVLHLSLTPRIRPLPLPPPFVGSLGLGDPMFVGPGGGTDGEGAWDSGAIPIPGTAVPVTLYFQGVLLSGGQIFLSNCIPLHISP